MALLGWPLILALSALAVLVIAGTYVCWGRVRGPLAARVAARAGMLVANQLVAVLLLGAALNNWGYFYSSWADLLGTQTNHGHLVEASGPGPVLAGGTGRGVVPMNKPHKTTRAQRHGWARDGRLVAVRISGSATGLSTDAYVWLPPQYFQHRYAHSRFHAVEVMTGYPGSPVQLVRTIRYPAEALSLVRSHQMRPMVLVMTQVDIGMRRDTECTDVYAGPQVESFLGQDLPASISAAYRVRPNGWGAIGDSTGGYCAAKLAMLNPHVFSAAVSLSGYFTTLHDVTTGSLWGGSRRLRNLNNLDWRMQHLPAPPVSLLVASTGQQSQSAQGIANSRTFISLAKPPMRVSSLIQPYGGHNPHTWRSELPIVLPWLSAHV